MQDSLTLFPEMARCQNRDCLQLWFCLSAPSLNMHNSAAQRPGGMRGKGGHKTREDTEGENTV